MDLTTEDFPDADATDACEKAALRLRYIARFLQSGEISTEDLQKNLNYAARVLEARTTETKNSEISRENSTDTTSAVDIDKSSLTEEDDVLPEVQPHVVPAEVRDWLSSTFTRKLVSTQKANEEKPKFRTVAHAIRAGIFVDRIYRQLLNSSFSQFPPEVLKILKNLDNWTFDQFALADVTQGQPMKYLGYDLLSRYGLIQKFKIAPAVLEQFLVKLEEGYCRYRNPYHNNLHAADVAQTIHYMLYHTGLMNFLTDLEIFAVLIAALIHDYEHTGTTNSFHVKTSSEIALLYNDRAVLENHHASSAFRMLKEDKYNIFANLSKEDYHDIRTLIIDMVISTDMSLHNHQLIAMKKLIALSATETFSRKATSDLKLKTLSYILHCCDISHPAKEWGIHHRWTMLLIEEFFRQGDLERKLGIDISPLCDRNTTVIPRSQIVFIEVIVEPSFSVCADLIELILKDFRHTSHDRKHDANEVFSIKKELDVTKSKKEPSSNAQNKTIIKKPWITCMHENKTKWQEEESKGELC